MRSGGSARPRRSGRASRSIWPGHQITEMGLVKLYRVTGNAALPDAREVHARRARAGRSRARSANPRGLDYNQSQQKVIEQTEAVGHAVRATYMYSGMADVAALTGDAAYVQAIDTIWDNIGRQEALPHRRHRRDRRRRGVRRAVRAAEHDRLQRDLRLGRHGLSGTIACSCSTATRSTST